MPDTNPDILNLLIVDDEPYLGEIYEGEFEEEVNAGHLRLRSFTGVTDCLQELDTLKGTAQIVIISDLHMPGLSGIDLLERTRDFQGNLDIYICSGSGLSSEREAALSYGAAGLLPKPIDLFKLRQMLVEKYGLHSLAS